MDRTQPNTELTEYEHREWSAMGYPPVGVKSVPKGKYKCGGCNNSVTRLKAKGLCGSCYQKQRPKAVCKGCGRSRPVRARGLCNSCYSMKLRARGRSPRGKR